MSSTTTNPSAAVARLAKAKRALITCHMSPAGDAIGSELALAELATALGVKTMIVNRDPAPAPLRRLPGAEAITVAETLPTDFRDTFDHLARGWPARLIDELLPQAWRPA